MLICFYMSYVGHVICYTISDMKYDSSSHIKPLRPNGLPKDLREALKQARLDRGWSQRDLSSRLGLPQTHISGIESGKIVPRYDTLLELVRSLDHDLVMVPRPLVPVVQSLIRDRLHPYRQGEGEERSLYADGDNDVSTQEQRKDEV